MLTLISFDGLQPFTIKSSEAFVSLKIKRQHETDSKQTSFILEKVTTPALAHIVEYMTHHGDEKEVSIPEKPLRSKIMSDVCKDPWDAKFIDDMGCNQQMLYDVIMAAWELEMKGLVHLGCAKVASLMKGQPLEKIKSILTPPVCSSCQGKALTVEMFQPSPDEAFRKRMRCTNKDCSAVGKPFEV